MERQLRPYQKSDVQFLTQYDCTGCFNEQRTGKTPTALMCMKERNLDNDKILVVTTASALYQWKDEYEAWLNRPCLICEGAPKKKAKIISEWTHGLVISLGSLKETSTRDGCLEMILKQKPKAVILDEAHNIRNTKTWAARAMFKFNKVKVRMALTGTPAYGEPKDIYAILHFLFPDKFNSIYRFYDEYLQQEKIYIYAQGQKRTIVKYTNFLKGKEEQLQQFLAKYCTQRKRKDVMQWLPEKDKQEIKLPLTEEQKKYIKELKDTFETESVKTQGVLDRLVRFRQICLDPQLIELKGTSPKTDWIKNFIKDNPDTPLIIFSNFTQYLTKLYQELKESGVKEAMIIGEVPSKQRAKFQDDFQNGKFNVFLINTMSGKEALTLDRAEAIIFTDVYPPIGAIEQAEDRFIATTEARKDKPHTIYTLMMKDSFDETIQKLLKERKTETEVINNFREQLNRKEKENE